MDTIYAVSSGALPAAIAVLRVSGPCAFDMVRDFAGDLPAPRRAAVRALHDPADGSLLDRALILCFPGPRSATGEDLAELHLHGGRAVVRAVEAALAGRSGLRPAEPGEFTRRALLHGRIDLSEAEGLGDLLMAETEAQRRSAIRSAEGAVRRAVEGWTDRLLMLAARVEAELDHSDEDDVADAALLPALRSGAAALAEDIEAVADRPPVERLRDGIRVVLAGPPNAGKSSLLNRMIGRDAAIVSPISGTTRDRIEAPVVRGGTAWLLIDTAGLAALPGDEIEAIGIARAQAAQAEADILLWLGDEPPPEHAHCLWLNPRADLPGRMAAADRLSLSSLTGEGLDALWSAMAQLAADMLPPTDQMALNARQRALSRNAASALRAAQREEDLLLIAEQLRSAMRAFDAITGRAGVEAMLDALFARFCIGKQAVPRGTLLTRPCAFCSARPMDFDVIVIGGGHAGTEAAAASARRGARTALLSFDLTKLGAMSCNPAIGGLGKGHLVREVDAFDGLMARATDAAGIHYRMLNRSKGTAVQGPRVQADRRRYAAAIQKMLAGQPDLMLVAGEAEALELDGGAVAGIRLADGRLLSCRAVVLATGTFLGGRIFRGEERETGGRVGEGSAIRLAEQLRGLNLPMARLKTGTPPRLDGRTVDWARIEEQPSDADPWTMSPLTPRRMLPQLHCGVTRTTHATHDAIRAGLDRSPLFTGAIDAQGPRYCPSIEDKIHRFGDRDGHQIFLEPEGLDTHLIYPNGMSTSLPVDVQRAMVNSIPGLEHTAIVTPGYAVEYDHIDPRALDATLALPAIPGLWCAGQINGTTGYEEAAGQGLVAGLNAAAHARGLAPLILDRATSYLGVMVDDLVLQGVTEPYRMLTARAEFRLRLRADNAGSRLGPIAAGLGALGPERLAWLHARERGRAGLDAAFAVERTASALAARGATVAQDGARRPAREWLRFPGIELQHLDIHPEADPDLLAEYVEDARYAPYLERQEAEVAQLRANDAVKLPAAMDFTAIAGLSNEMVEKLSASRPETIGAAARIRGITPAALSAILLHAKRRAA